MTIMDNKLIDDFYEILIHRLSQAYQDELFKVFDNMPKAIIRFNDVDLLKKAQMYVRHTDRIFGKAIAKLFCSLFASIGHSAYVNDDRLGKCVFDKSNAARYHFFPLEKLAGFVKTPWFKNMSGATKQNQIFDAYILLTEKDSRSENYINELNGALEHEYRRFVCIEDFVIENFSKSVWDYLNDAFKKIEEQASSFQWFELVGVCNGLNYNKLQNSIESSLINFDYEQELKQTRIKIDERSFATMKNQFLTRKAYKYLFEASDFSQSLFTSEWLYNNNYISNLLDNTFYITGYVKSVEQLLCWIISGFSSDYSISINTTNGIKTVSIDSPDFFKATLGNMLFFLKNFENRAIYHSGIDPFAIQGLYKIINTWVQNERNGYFHKDNFSRKERIEAIRNRTFLVYFLLLGSINLDA